MTSPSLDNVVRTYRFYAPLYDRVFGAVLEPGRRAMMARIGVVQPASVLEVGVGTGLTLARYPAATAVTGIDVSSEMLDLAKCRAQSIARNNMHFMLMDAEQIEFPDAHFDCVAVPYVLSVTPNPRRLVSEIRRVCRKGGSIFILNHFSDSRFWWLMERAVKSLADRIGFRSDFDYSEHILGHNWQVNAVTRVNLMGLSKLVEIRNV